MAPLLLGRINPVTHTPVISTVLITGLILVFALAMPITQLAQITSFIMLIIFLLVNLSLVQIKRRHLAPWEGISFSCGRPSLWCPVVRGNAVDSVHFHPGRVLIEVRAVKYNRTCIFLIKPITLTV